MAERRFLLVDADVLPEVFVKVVQAKELLASGAVSNISAAAKQAGISRSAFYKYKDTVFDAETGRESITVVATLLDKTGALQGLLSGINALGIGPQGFGGRTTALAVKILAYPTHIAGLPVAVNINCHATRHKEITL